MPTKESKAPKDHCLGQSSSNILPTITHFRCSYNKPTRSAHQLARG